MNADKLPTSAFSIKLYTETIETIKGMLTELQKKCGQDTKEWWELNTLKDRLEVVIRLLKDGKYSSENE